MQSFAFYDDLSIVKALLLLRCQKKRAHYEFSPWARETYDSFVDIHRGWLFVGFREISVQPAEP
jgi:hypothetical protein